MKEFEIEKWDGKDIIIYGAGSIGKQVYRYLKNRIPKNDVIWFCDKLYENKFIDGKPILAPQQLNEYRNANFLIASTSFAQEIYLHLKRNQLNKVFAVPQGSFSDEFKSEIIRYQSIINTLAEDDHGIILPNIGLTITDVCTLRCKDCMALMPYYKTPKKAQAEMVYASFDKLLSIVEEIGSVALIGGEPLTNQPLINEILLRYGNHKKIGAFYIVTNGTILPDEKCLAVLKKTNTIVFFSNYGMLSQKMDAAIKIMEENNISYDVQNEMRAPWYMQGELRNYKRALEADQQLYYACNLKKGCSRLSHGEFHLCDRSSSGTYLGAVPKVKGDYIDLLDDSLTLAELQTQMRSLLERKEPIKACSYCGLNPELRVERAKQVKDILNWKI